MLSLYKKGFTLVEILIVFSLASVFIIFGIRLLSVFSDFSMDVSSYQNIDYYFTLTKQKSLSTGKKYTLEMNLEDKIFGIREFISRLDDTFDHTIDTLSEKSYERTLKKLEFDSNETKIEKEPIEWFIKQQKLPKNFEKVFSISLLEIKGPILRIFFYPNGTSDSVIFRYTENKSTKYLYLPNSNQPSRIFLSEELEKYIISSDILAEVESEPALIDLKSIIR